VRNSEKGKGSEVWASGPKPEDNYKLQSGGETRFKNWIGRFADPFSSAALESETKYFRSSFTNVDMIAMQFDYYHSRM
jgi:hypothetical protein